MLPAIVIPIYSSDFQDLQRVFNSLERPYRLGDIVRFNLAYQKIYWRLSSEERRRAEEFVDALIEGVERPELASKIFGVV